MSVPRLIESDVAFGDGDPDQRRKQALGSRLQVVRFVAGALPEILLDHLLSAVGDKNAVDAVHNADLPNRSVQGRRVGSVFERVADPQS